MKLNWSFFINTVLTITLLTSATLSAQCKEVTNYAQDHSSENHSEVIVARVANSSREDSMAESLHQEFNLKNTIEKELAFAILIIVMCQLVQYSSKSVEQATSGVLNKSEYHYIFVGLGYFYQSINDRKEAKENLKEKVDLNKK